MDVILTHENADFDAVASQLAAHMLTPEAAPVLPSRLNRNVRDYLAVYGDKFPFWNADDLPRRPIGRVILVDTQHVQTVRGMGKRTQVQVIDHHPHDLPAKPNWSVSVDEVGANTTLLVEQIQARGLSITPVEATLLALGIYEDTGSLNYGTTTPRDIRAAAWVIEQGASLDTVRRFLRHALDDDQRRLLELLIENLESHVINGQSVIIAAARCESPIAEIATLAHHLRDVFEASALFVAVDLGTHVQLIARSTSDAVNVGAVAERMGGGGHSRAAAAIIKGRSLDEIKSEILAHLAAIIQPVVTVAVLMSNGVQTLGPTVKAREAHAKMRRYGYEGFPVVKDGRIVGLITRRAVDRALDHGLDSARVEQLMEVGGVSVQPGDSISTLQQIMMSSGWGQVPVVDEYGALLGVVTRTDLIKHLGLPPQRLPSPSEIVARLEAALPPALLTLAKEAGRVADDGGTRLFIVGGVVRDLLLGFPLSDLDFVVEGDAIELTRRLRDRFGGQMRSHSRFGTGKWLLDEAAWGQIGHDLGVAADPGQLPAHIDFVTARTEFYSAPTELPEVERSSIKHDLHRRDFTINTLAIRLDPPGFGQLLDFYGGVRDLHEKRIRVLHSISFLDDPTRILRAARLEQRLGFQIDARTDELIGHALPVLNRVSGDRIRHELDLIFQEPEPEGALRRIDDLGVLRSLHAELVWQDDPMRRQYAALREARQRPLWPELAGIDLTLPYFGALTFPLSHPQIRALCDRIKVRHRTTATLERLHQLKPRLPELGAGLRPSQIDSILAQSSDWVLVTAWAVAPTLTAAEAVLDYARRLRHMMPVTDGDALKQLGLKPGPLYRTVLDRLRRALLDGEVATRQQEIELLHTILAQAEQQDARETV